MDANCAWTAEETIEKSRALAALGVEFIEQPLPAEKLEEMAEVRRRSALPLYADESAITAEDLPRLAGRFDGIVHAIGFAPEDALGGNFLNTPWESVQTAFRVSTFSLKEIAATLAPIMKPGAGIVTLDFDNTTQAWPTYDWMGVCKAGLEATVRYLARDLGPKKIRVNALAAGPLQTVAAKSIPGFRTLERRWGKQAPLGWDSKNEHESVARTACVMLSDWMSSTTGELVHVDGGYHAVGAAPIDPAEDEREGA